MRDFHFDLEKAAVLLEMMANPARLKVLEMVCEKEWDVTALSEAVNLSQSALSQHLRKLRDANLVTTRRDRQSILYSCRFAGVLRVLETLNAIYSAPKKAAKAS